MNDADAAITAIARFYDLDCGHLDADIAMYRNFAQGSETVLELGAGTGRVAVPLAERGCAVVAVEANPAMRAAGAARMAAAGVEVVAADLRALHLGRTFDLVIVALSTFCHLLTRADQLAALASVRSHLAPHGRAVFDLAVPEPSNLEPGPQPVVLEWTRRDPRTGRWVTKWATSEADPASQLEWLTYLYDEQAEDGAVRRTQARFPLRNVFRFELHGLLAAAGLAVCGEYGSYDMDPVEAGARLIVVAQRAAPKAGRGGAEAGGERSG